MAALPKAQQPDWEDIRLAEILKGARRDISGRRGIDRAKPLSKEDMRDAFDMMTSGTIREARDLAILALAYAGCRRRSEITGLDYAVRGEGSDGTGILEVAEDGIWIVLLRSKTSQEGEPKRFFINRKAAPQCCSAIEAWIEAGGIAPGTPVLRAIRGTGKSGMVDIQPVRNRWRAHTGRGAARRCLGTFATKEAAVAAQWAAADPANPSRSPVFAERITRGDSINNVIKRRMYEILCHRRLADSKRKRLRPEEEAECRAAADEYSGHSGRRGSLRDHFEAGGSRHDAIAMSGHTPGSAMLDTYSLETDAKKHKFLHGSGL